MFIAFVMSALKVHHKIQFLLMFFVFGFRRSFCADQCNGIALLRHQEMDDYNFMNNWLKDITDIALRVECVWHCHRTDNCNVVLYSSSSEICRLYSDVSLGKVDGTVENGWEFFAAPCQMRRPPNAPAPMCTGHSQLSCSCASACWDGVEWTCTRRKCVNYFSTPRLGLDQGQGYNEVLTFDLSEGMSFEFEITGKNDGMFFNLKREDGATIIHTAVYENLNQLKFNTYDNAWQQEHSAALLLTGGPVTQKIEILSDTFKIYVNEELKISAPIRFPMANFRTLNFYAVTSISRFDVSTNGNCS